MNIDNIDINNYKQNFNIEIKEKNLFGIVYTPFFLIKQILNLIPDEKYNDPDMKWLDMGAGTGYFSICLFDRLNKGLEKIFPNRQERKDHIIEKMLYMSEIKEDHILILQKIFGEKANIFGDFLSIDKKYLFFFDFIIGNPPYNHGKIKTPTNHLIDKKKDGKIIWPNFIQKSLKLLKPEGYLCPIIPSLWLKPDKIGIYNILTQLKILSLHTLTNTETNKIFNYKAQTPTCFFLLQKKMRDNQELNIYDKFMKTYISYYLRPSYPIPLYGISIINKILKYIDIYGTLKVFKTNSPSKKSMFSSEFSSEFPYKNINTCILGKINKLKPKLLINYSSISQVGYEKMKLVLAHKMYGFPFLDISGIYGVSARDNYIIQDYSIDDLIRIQKFLSTKVALFIYSATSYRMKYLEKYAFEFFPDISKIKFWKEIDIGEINDKTIINFFEFSLREREIIYKMHKNYLFF